MKIFKYFVVIFIFINGPRPYDDSENYDFVYLDDIDKGEPFVTEDDKFRDECVKKEKNIIKKILLEKPEIYNSSYHFNNVLESQKKRNRIFLKNWGIEELLNKIKKDDFDFYSLEKVPDYFCETLEKILANIEDYHEKYDFIYDL